MLEKVILLILDGLGGRPIMEFSNKTPLEYANTANLDELAKSSECGMMHTMGRGIKPGSDVAHLNIFGYDPRKYYPGRGPIEAAGLSMELEPGDVAFRGNLGRVDDKMVIRDRRTGRIENVEPFTEILDGMEIDGVKFIVKPGSTYRSVVIMRGKNLSSAITDADPHIVNMPVQKVEPTDSTNEARHTADVLNNFLAKAHDILKAHKLNEQRKKEGKPETNFLLVRGPGKYRPIPKFIDRYGLSACCIAGGGLYKGVSTYLGMEILKIPGATGTPKTDIEAKFNAALKSLETFDFVFVHVKAADSLGEDGDFEGKKDFIERIDQASVILQQIPENTLLIVSSDHSTPCELKSHSADPIPIIFYGKGVRVDDVSAFNERSCTKGGLGFIEGKDVMPHILNLMGRLHLMGG